jgi:hypothetical protein
VSDELYTMAEHYCKSFGLHRTAIVRSLRHREQ